MSKSAANYIRANVSGRTADLLLDVLYTPAIRKNWRNADVLAMFLVDTVANAYECENSSTFAENGFTDMEDAIESYIEANLCDWDQAKYLASSFGKRTALEISDRLAEKVFKNTAFELKQKTAGLMHAEALEMARAIDSKGYGAVLDTATRAWCEEARERWLVRRKVVRDAACSHGDAFASFSAQADHQDFTHECIAWLYMMDEALILNAAIDAHITENAFRADRILTDAGMYTPDNRALVGSAAHYISERRNPAKCLAHQYKERMEDSQRTSTAYRAMHAAFELTLNAAIQAGHVAQVNLYWRVIDFTDGSVLTFNEGSWTQYGFYAQYQTKRC